MKTESSLSAGKQALLDKWLSGKVRTATGIARRGDTTGPVALSFAQQRLWFIDQFEPDSPLYNMPAALRLLGRLERHVLERTLDEVVRRHEALRTHFEMREDEPCQVIRDVGLCLDVIDLSGLPEAQREADMRLHVEEEALQPFDLGAGPLIRAKLLRLGMEEHVLLFTMHHIVSDGWSMGILVNEVVAIYTAFVQGEPSPLPELAVQYPDFAIWQRQVLGGDGLQKQIAYWRAQLSGAPGLLNLPVDRPRPAMQTHHGAHHYFDVDAALTEGLNALGKRHQASMFMLLNAALAILLSRHAGQDDVCIGTPIANRKMPELEPLIGFFANTLVMRTLVNENESFVDLLGRVRRTALDAYAHQDLPFEQLVEALKPERQASYSPLFQVMLALQNTTPSKIDLPGLVLEPIAAERVTAKFDLMLNAVEVGGLLSCHFEYNTDLFD
ncbi:MAG TPA: condensation domain-containing protein, partial [Noviherbaspirillum sp.]